MINLTPFAADSSRFKPDGPTGPTRLLVKATLVPGEGAVLGPAEVQLSLVGPDLHFADPETSAVRYESDFVPFKPRADLLCVGKACAPEGQQVTECLVSFSVGSMSKSILVRGERLWKPVLGRLLVFSTRPRPFTSIPVSYENAYGGKNAGKPDGFRFHPFNAVGKGYSRWGGGLKGLALPNLEDPRRPIRHWWSRPKPVSFGPVGRTWLPRIRRAGTYNKQWLKQRAPLLPEDFDEGFYNCAPEDQQMEGYLRGDEEIRVENMHPKHADFRCRLPGIRVRAFVDRKRDGKPQLEEVAMNLDTLWVDMEALQVVLVWRGQIPAAGLEGQGPVLIVEEPLNSTPRPAESYRPELEKHAAEEREAEKVVEEAEKELEQMEKTAAAELTAGAGEK